MNRRDIATLIVLVIILVVLLPPPQPLVSIGPQQSVVTNNPKLGVHTRREAVTIALDAMLAAE